MVLPPSETYTAIDKGVVDAGDDSTYSMNDSVGFQRWRKYPIYPGIHSMPVMQLTVNKAACGQALSPAHRAMLDVWYRAMMDDLRMRNEHRATAKLVARDTADKARRDRDRRLAAGRARQVPRDRAPARGRTTPQASPSCREGLRAQVEFMKRDRPAAGRLQ